jgi:hypothetical protein
MIFAALCENSVPKNILVCHSPFPHYIIIWWNWGVRTPFVVFRHTHVYDGLSHNVFLLLFWLIITVVIPCVPLLDWSMELNIVFTVLLLIISHHIRIMSYHVPMISPLFFYPQIWWWITIFRNDHFGVPLFSDSSNWMFHYKPSILGILDFRKAPYLN